MSMTPNGSEPQGQGPNPNPIKQTTYRAVQISVVSGPGGRALVIDTPTEQLVLPMTNDEARSVGSGLIAPSVELPGQG